MNPASCTILEVLKNYRYNVSVTPVSNLDAPYTTITKSTKKGFNNFHRGQKLQCFYSPDNLHGYLKWEIQFHSQRKSSSIGEWVTRDFIIASSILTELLLCFGYAVLTSSRSQDHQFARQDARPEAGKYTKRIFRVLYLFLLLLWFPIASYMSVFVYKEKLSEANCTFFEEIPNGLYNVSVVPATSIFKPFTTTINITEKGLEDIEQGQRVLCYFEDECVPRQTQYDVQFHSNMKDFSWSSGFRDGFLLLLLYLLMLYSSYSRWR